MKPKGLCNGVDQSEVRYTRRHNITKIEANKVPISDYGLVADAADFKEDEEDDGDEEEERG